SNGPPPARSSRLSRSTIRRNAASFSHSSYPCTIRRISSADRYALVERRQITRFTRRWDLEVATTVTLSSEPGDQLVDTRILGGEGVAAGHRRQRAVRDLEVDPVH